MREIVSIESMLQITFTGTTRQGQTGAYLDVFFEVLIIQ